MIASVQPQGITPFTLYLLVMAFQITWLFNRRYARMFYATEVNATRADAQTMVRGCTLALVHGYGVCIGSAAILFLGTSHLSFAGMVCIAINMWLILMEVDNTRAVRQRIVVAVSTESAVNPPSSDHAQPTSDSDTLRDRR
jgi:hypothetical protein